MVTSDASVRLNRIHYPVSTLGPGTRIGVWFQGCSIGCGGCVSRDTWDPEGAPLTSIDDVVDRMDRLVGGAPGLIDGVTVSGGEPFDQPLPLASLLLATRSWLDDRGSEPADLLAYTGYDLDEATLRGPEALDVLDGLIVGPYQSGHPSGAAWWGSANQRMVPLTERGRDRYDVSPATGDVQIDVDADGRVWIIGIPSPRLLARVEARLSTAGIRLTEVSWRP